MRGGGEWSGMGFVDNVGRICMPCKYNPERHAIHQQKFGA